MRTLIVPCGGKSSRFPNMKPKYLLTYPDGSLMIEKALSGINLDSFDRIIITIVKEHDETYGAKLILEQVFEIETHNNFVVCVLNDFTSCQAETVIKTIVMEGITGEIIIKDSDNYVKIENIESNAIVGLNIEAFPKEINRLSSKSFLVINDQKNIVDIIEKKIKSQYICIGVYCFTDAAIFIHAYNSMINQSNENNYEIYISHIVSYLIGLNECTFKYIEAEDYEDWGTLDDWKIVQKKHKTYFIDLDGVLLNNRGKYGSKNWSNSLEPLTENMNAIKQLYNEGAQIIITTSREEKYRNKILTFFEDNNIKLHALVMGCNHSCRVIINDFAPTNPFPSCETINIKRNGDLSDYLQ
jgi:hypothetical protein